MTRRFQVGDRVRVFWPQEPEWHGRVGVITRVQISAISREWKGAVHVAGEPVYQLDIFERDLDRLAAQQLRPIHDGDEKLSWSDERVVWKPRAIA